MTGKVPQRRCRAGTEATRCDFWGSRDDLREHAATVGHPRCIVCTDALNRHEQQTCTRCAQAVRDDLAGVAVAYAHLERIISQTAYRIGGGIPGGHALVYLADGSVERPTHAYETAETSPHPLARVGESPPPKIRDEWLTDPTPVLASLEANERVWRRRFGHGPADDIATVASCLTYLQTWHTTAARTHPDFDDYAAEIRELRGRLEHLVGLADDPVTAPIWCTCGGKLERHFAPQGGLADDWTCRRCGESFDDAAYLLRLRVLTEVPGWVSVESAARAVGRPPATVWAWRFEHVPVASNRFTKRTVVELAAVQARSAVTGRVTSRRSA